jgi:tape measure domain-containing protein
VSTISSNNIVVNYVVNSDALNKAADQFDNLTNAERASINETKKLNRALKETGDEGQKSAKNVKDGFSGLGNVANSLKSTLGGLFAIGALKQFATSIFNTTASFESLRASIDAATGSQEKGAESFQYLITLSNTYGKNLQSLAGSYSSMTAAANFAGISLEQSNKIFESAVMASTALGKSNEDTQGILLAFSQIISKGTVASEELRGQIGERLPGAFNLAAKAMGVTTQQLGKMLQKGEVISKEFLPKFAVELEKAFGAGAEAKMNSMTASLGRFSTAWDRLLNSPGLGKYMAETLNLLTMIFDESRKLFTDDETLKKEEAAKVASNITQNLKKELDTRLKEIQKTTSKEATMDQVALQKWTEIQAYRSKLIDDLAVLRVKSAGSMNTLELKTAENNLKYADIALEAVEKLINGTEVLSKKKQELSAEDIKRLKAEYKAMLDIIDAQEKIAALKIEATTPDDFKRGQKLLENQIAFNQKRLVVDRKYEKLRVEDAKLNGDLRVAENLKYNSDIVANEKKHNEEIKKKWDELTQSLIDKARKRGQLIQGAEEDRYKADVEMINNRREIEEINIQALGLAEKEEKKRLIQNNINFNEQEIKVQEDAAKKGIENAQAKADKLRAINNKLNADLKNADKMSAEERDAIVEKSFELASTLYQGFSDLYLAGKSNELAATSAYYDEQMRLAGDNEQKKVQLEEERRAKEKQIRTEMFRAQQAAAVAEVIFKTAPLFAAQSSNPLTGALAVLTAGIAAAQIAFILAQPVPAYKDGTKGKGHKGGYAFVGDGGESELITTPGGKSFWSPATTTLVDLPKGSQVFNQKQLSQELFLGTAMSRQGRQSNGSDRVVERLASIENALMGLPITQLNMDERGFEKYIRTPKRTTKILNNRFPSN